MIKTIINLPTTVTSNIRKIVVELRQVDWLSPKEVAKSTAIVMAIAIATTLMIMAMDFVLVQVRNFLFANVSI